LFWENNCLICYMEISFDSIMLMQVPGQIAAEAKMLHRKSYLITKSYTGAPGETGQDSSDWTAVSEMGTIGMPFQQLLTENSQ
ncbi:unnamed protein product, partial [Bubo scandiacus]